MESFDTWKIVSLSSHPVLVLVALVVALFAIMDKTSGVNYRTHINPEEMQ